MRHLTCKEKTSFPRPKIFTNALLNNDDITSLIRDTEPHERALFSVPPPPPPPTTSKQQPQEAAPAPSQQQSKRRQTVFNVASGEVTTGGPPGTRPGAGHPRRHTAVAAVLGGEMHEQLRGVGGGAGSSSAADRKGDVDVDVLLRGAEKLCGVYELPGARERIAEIRARHRNGKATLAYYENKVAEQLEQLASQNRGWMDDDDDDEDDGEEGRGGEAPWTEDDLRREEEEAKEMEKKKRELQARLRAMNKDLGGLMNMT